MDKFILKKQRGAREALRGISIWASTYEMAKQMSFESGVSMVEVIDRALRFCRERLEIVEVE